MDIDRYRQRLQSEEKKLLKGLERQKDNVQGLGGPQTGDATDRSVSGELKEEQFQDAELNRSLLQQVQEALQRIEAGTYGKCAADGGPIDETRLEAMPWTPYCIRHQRPLEAADPPRTPTL